METIKSFTDISQSKKLAEILPLESADMHYCLEDRDVTTGYEIGISPFIKAKRFEGKCNIVDVQPAWSLAALLGVLPNNKHITTTLLRGGWKIEPVEYIDKWFCDYEDEDSPYRDFTVSADNPIDACVAMIEKLHELNLL